MGTRLIIIDQKTSFITKTNKKKQNANAYQVYQHWAQQQQQQPIHHKPPPTLNPFKILKNRQDSFAGDIEAFFGPDAGTLLGALGALMGTIALFGAGANAINVQSLSTDQDSICTAVKTLGAIDVSSATTTDTTTGTELNALITAIEAVSTPSC